MWISFGWIKRIMIFIKMFKVLEVRWKNKKNNSTWPEYSLWYEVSFWERMQKKYQIFFFIPENCIKVQLFIGSTFIFFSSSFLSFNPKENPEKKKKITTRASLKLSKNTERTSIDSDSLWKFPYKMYNVTDRK